MTENDAAIEERGATPEPGDAGAAPEAETGRGRSVEAEVRIDVPVERVWEALTDAGELVRWFPLEARVKPGVGGEYWMSWKNEFEGASRILAWEPPRRLLTSWGEVDGNEASGQRTEYRLEARGGATYLRVVTSGFPEDPSWDGWVEGTQRGWIFELFSLKHYLERHPGEEREVLYLRRRTSLPRQEAWQRLTGPDGLAPEDFGGVVVDASPPAQYAALAESPPGLLRISMEPCHDGPDGLDVTLWLSAWGDHAADLERLREEWRALLAGLFPEGAFV
jgi:uncharacterized protein YndB with AHSA1/START domain